MAPPDNCSEIKRIRTYVEAAESEINGLKIIPRIQTRYAFDSVALSTVSKAFALSQSLLLKGKRLYGRELQNLLFTMYLSR